MKKLLLCTMFAGAWGCNNGGTVDHHLFTPKPECMGADLVPYMGTSPQVISTLAIGSVADGFDLDGNGTPDNKLAAVGSLAQSAITTSLMNNEIVIPLEFFGLTSATDDSCVKFGIYLADYNRDEDMDGKKTAHSGGDCNDHDATIFPGAAEVAGDGKDNNCDGLADEIGPGQPNTTDTMDRDHDGQTVADGDCDDTDATVYKGAPEICGDGKDNDCDGIADRTTADPTVCSPFNAAAPVDVYLDPLSFDDSGNPVIAFKDGSIVGGVLNAGPGLFGVNIPVSDGITLDLQISGATIQANAVMMGDSIVFTGGRLGGVLDAKTMDTLRGLNVSQIGLTAEDSLLDATFANILGPLLALPKGNAAVHKKNAGCRTPDIDVDGDGLESFCDSTANSAEDMKVVDVCIDGDGTEIDDVVNGDGTVTQCTTAVDSKGNPRFVDGISVELNFTTSPIKSIKPPTQ